MTKFVIGKEIYETGPISFKRLKKMWPLVSGMVQRVAAPNFQTLEGVEEGFAAIEVACQVAAIALEKDHPQLTADVIEDTILPTEVQALSASIQELLKESGLSQGELVPSAGNQANPSTATGTQSSPNLSQPELKEEAGIE